MPEIQNLTFKRKFSRTLYKNLKLRLGEMSFYKDFVHTDRGDMYPILADGGVYEESVADGGYRFIGKADAFAVRLLGQHFPYATYEVTVRHLQGTAGLRFTLPDGTSFDVCFTVRDGLLYMGRDSMCGRFTPGMSFIVTCRGAFFDVYRKVSGGMPVFVQTLHAPAFCDVCREAVFSGTTAALCLSGEAELDAVSFYMDCGISQADMRPIRYENGDVIVENGRIYLTMSVRMQEGCYQGIFSLIPGTDEFELTGSLFYDAGDGIWANDVAASVLYHRGEKKWYLWVCSFSHGHRLAHAACEGDIRFGVNVADVTLMPSMRDGDSDKDFRGKQGDEDPDFLYDEKNGLWYMTICRLVSDCDGTNYRYFLFRSENPFEGYRYVGHAASGAETGGSLVRDDGGLAFICGSGFDRRAEYHVYRVPDFSSYSLLTCDYDDGGFRGWGTVIPLRGGSRRRYFWLTFDRHGASPYTWSYGNLYCFEAGGKNV